LLPQVHGRTADVDAGLGRAGERDVLSKAKLKAVLPVTRVRTDAGAGAGDLSRVVATRNRLAIDGREAQKGVKTGVSKARGVLVNWAAVQVNGGHQLPTETRVSREGGHVVARLS